MIRKAGRSDAKSQALMPYSLIMILGLVILAIIAVPLLIIVYWLQW